MTETGSFIVVAVRPRKRGGQGATVLGSTVHATRADAEEQVREQRIADSMFNDRTPRLVVLEVPGGDGHE